jgi:hypothetical protein
MVNADAGLVAGATGHLRRCPRGLRGGIEEGPQASRSPGGWDQPVTGRKQVQYRPHSWVEHEGCAGLGDSDGAQRPPPFDELGEFGFDVDADEAEEVDVLAVAGAMKDSSSSGTSRPWPGSSPMPMP